jgi:hypothetical protein
MTKMLKSLAGEIKLLAVLAFVVGTVWIYAWSSHMQAKADKGFSIPAPDNEAIARIVQARLDDD